jgi:hypothetical protein
VVILHADFAGVKAGQTMLISSPEEIGSYVASIARGEIRTIARMRSDLARRAGAAAMCPVTTAIYLRVVAECALRDLDEGKSLDSVVPFWRVIDTAEKVAQKLSCGPDHILHLRALDAAADGG